MEQQSHYRRSIAARTSLGQCRGVLDGWCDRIAHAWRWRSTSGAFLPKGKWPLLLAIADESLSTEKAREVLPRHYSRHDLVANIQNSMLLLAALFQATRSCWLPRSKTAFINLIGRRFARSCLRLRIFPNERAFWARC